MDVTRKELLLQRVEYLIKIKASRTESNPYSFVMQKIPDELEHEIEKRRKKMGQEKSLYDLVCEYILRLKDRRFLFKNGNVNGTAFADYACIDKSTWTDLRWGQAVMSKKTLLKLVIALQLNEEEADDLMRRASNGFDPKDIRDQIILALVDMKCYIIEDVYEVLEAYREKGHNFKNIYD